MSVTPVPYPLDLTGTNAINLVTGEIQTLVQRPIRCVAPYNNPFYTASLVITDNATNQHLTSSQYYCGQLCVTPTQLSGQQVCAVIIITDPTVSNNITLQYQTIGGGFTQSAALIVEMFNNIMLDDRPVSWPNIINKPSEFPPSFHFHDIGDIYGFEYVTFALERIRDALLMGDEVSHEEIYKYIDTSIATLSAQETAAIAAAIAAHVAAPNPHPQYELAVNASSFALVRTPTNVAPVNGAINVNPNLVINASEYYSLYGVSQGAAEFRMSTTAGCLPPYTFDTTLNGAVTSYNYGSLLASQTVYYWQARYQDSEGVWSGWSDVTSFTSALVGINAPFITSPANGSTVVASAVSLASTAFSTTGEADVQVSSDWEVWTGASGTGVLIWSSEGDTTNLTSITIPSGVLLNDTTYYPRVRYHGQVLNPSAWSANVSFVTAAVGIVIPTITSPLNGSTENQQSFNMTASSFQTVGQSDTLVKTVFEIWTAPQTTSPSTMVYTGTSTSSSPNVTINAGTLNNNTTYYARCYQQGASLGNSQYSPWSSFTMNFPLYPTVIGQAFGGGYYVGDISYGAHTYGIILAPVASEINSVELVNSNVDLNATDSSDSAANQAALLASGQSPAATAVAALNIGGFTDWCVPSINALFELLTNTIPTNSNTPAIYQTGGAQAFQPNIYYWSSTTQGAQGSYQEVDVPQSGGDPIYGNVTTNTPQSYNTFDNNFTPSCPAGQTVTNAGVYDQAETNPSTGQTAFLNEWTWQCTSTSTGVIGYTPVNPAYSYQQFSGYTIQAYASLSNQISNNTTLTSNFTARVRAIRLVQKS